VETKSRTLAKAVSWQGLGLITTTTLGYLATGSITAGGTLALSSATLGLVIYLAHERVWQRISWGRTGGNVSRKQG
jgi:uncharacterized membrane protein